MEQWLTSIIYGLHSSLDSSFLMNSHKIFSSNKKFIFTDFYNQSDDIDIKLTETVSVIANIDYDGNYNNYNDNNNDISEYYGKQQMNTENFIDSVFVKNELLSDEQKNELLSCVEQYGDKTVFISPGIILSHVNLLFKLMILQIKNNNMKITFPEINYINGKYNITYTQHYILTPNQKISFYQFCYENTYMRKKKLSVSRETPHIKYLQDNYHLNISKETFGRTELNNALKTNRQIRQEKEKQENNTEFKNLNYEDTVKLYNIIVEQYNNYNKWINNIWENVFEKYLNKENINCCVLDKLRKCSGGPIYAASPNGVFRAFFNSFPLILKIKQLMHRIGLTLEKHEIEYAKKMKDEEYKRQKNINKIDTNNLCGYLN